MNLQSKDVKLTLLVQGVIAMRLGLAPGVALRVTKAVVSGLEADARAGRPLVALGTAVRDEVWRRQAVCVVEVAGTLQPGDNLGEFAARLRPAYERVVGYVPAAETMPRLIGRLVRDRILAVADDGRWNVSPAARRAATAETGRGTAQPGSVLAPAGKGAAPTAPALSDAARLALVEADLLAHPGDTVAARARRLGPQLGLKDRAARGQISAMVSALRTAAQPFACEVSGPLRCVPGMGNNAAVNARSGRPEEQ